MANQLGATPLSTEGAVQDAEILATLETVLPVVEKAVQRLHADRRRAEEGRPYTGPERRMAHRDRRLAEVLAQVGSASDELKTMLPLLRRRVVRARLAAGNRASNLLTRIRAKNPPSAQTGWGEAGPGTQSPACAGRRVGLS